MSYRFTVWLTSELLFVGLILAILATADFVMPTQNHRPRTARRDGISLEPTLTAEAADPVDEYATAARDQ